MTAGEDPGPEHEASTDANVAATVPAAAHLLAGRRESRGTAVTPATVFAQARGGLRRILSAVDWSEVEEWVGAHVRPTDRLEVMHRRPWSTVARVPVEGGVVWFKACSEVQAFEPLLTAGLWVRWPDLVPDVLAFDEARSWMLLGDAGTRLGDLGNDPALWLTVLPRYAELQRAEADRALQHLGQGVPDLRTSTLPARYEEMLAGDLPLGPEDRQALEAFSPEFGRICEDVASRSVPDSIQHDDLHMNNVFLGVGLVRILDWGDASVSHPFVSLIATFRFLGERNGLPPDDPWFDTLRDAYLEPWGGDAAEVFPLAMRMGGFSHAIASLRQRAALGGLDRDRFDDDLAVRLKRALRAVEA